MPTAVDFKYQLGDSPRLRLSSKSRHPYHVFFSVPKGRLLTAIKNWKNRDFFKYLYLSAQNELEAHLSILFQIFLYILKLTRKTYFFNGVVGGGGLKKSGPKKIGKILFHTVFFCANCQDRWSCSWNAQFRCVFVQKNVLVTRNFRKNSVCSKMLSGAPPNIFWTKRHRIRASHWWIWQFCKYEQNINLSKTWLRFFNFSIVTAGSENQKNNTD